MKKAIIGLSGLVILAFVVVLFVNAKNSTEGVKKAATEVSATCAKCPSAATCTKMGDSKSTTCDPAKCKEMGCDPAKCKEGKCDPATCKTNCAEAKCEMKAGSAAGCSATCPMAKTIK